MYNNKTENRNKNTVKKRSFGVYLIRAVAVTNKR